MRTLTARESGYLGTKLPGEEVALAGATGKVNSQKPVAGFAEESDGNKVPAKSPNKGSEDPSEAMEGRTPAKRNSGQEAANRMQGREFASNGLARVRQSVRFDAKYSR